MTVGQRVFTYTTLAMVLFLLGAGMWGLVTSGNWIAVALSVLVLAESVVIIGAYADSTQDGAGDDK